MTIPELPIDFKYSTLGGPDRDFTIFEAWLDSTNGILIFGEWLDVYCDELEGPLELVLSGAATAKNYHRVIRLIGDSRKVTIRIEEANSYVIHWYDVTCWIADNPDQPARPQEGDILAVDLHNPDRDFGRVALGKMLVRTVEMTDAEATMLRKKHWEGGVDGEAVEAATDLGLMGIFQKYAVTIGEERVSSTGETIFPPTFVPVTKQAAYNDEVSTFLAANPMPKLIHSQRYVYPLAMAVQDMPDLDLKRLKDPKDIYQPFRSARTVIRSTSDKKAMIADKHIGCKFKYKTGATPLKLADR